MERTSQLLEGRIAAPRSGVCEVHCQCLTFRVSTWIVAMHFAARRFMGDRRLIVCREGALLHRQNGPTNDKV